MEFPNFYENLKEAQMRLRGTIVLYDGNPYYVAAITDHKKDGIFRIYLDPLRDNYSMSFNHDCPANHIPASASDLGSYMDEYMQKDIGKDMLRKHMNSPKFNKFRPFPLGMANYGGSAIFIQRTPTRRVEQGLTQNMLSQYSLRLSSVKENLPSKVSTWTSEFRDCILGVYPTPEECINKMNDNNVINASVGFHRDFALVRGPVGMLFLAYKEDVIGVMPSNDFSCVSLARPFIQCKEVVENLRIFNKIEVM